MRKKAVEQQRHCATDPEPITIALAILGAVGSAASIHSWVIQRGEVRKAERRERQVASAREILSTIAGSLERIQGHILTLREFIKRNGQPLGYNQLNGSRPALFGSHGLFLDEEGLKALGELHGNISDASKNMFAQVLKLIKNHGPESGMIDNVQQQRMTEILARLNGLIEQIGRMTYDELLGQLEGGTRALYDLLIEIRSSL